MSCTSLQGSLAWCEGKTVLPGIRKRLYYTSKQNIAAWPTLPTDTNGRPTSSTYTGSFTMKMTGDKSAIWNVIDVIVSKSGLTSEAQGEYPSQTQLNKLTAVHPGVDEAASMAAAYLNNNDCVFLIEDMPGKYRVLGSDKWQGTVTVAQDLGQGATGTASTTINAEATDLIPAPFYNGEIVLDEDRDNVINEAVNETSESSDEDEND